MDGARFANAVASLNCSPRTITWEVGVDVLCFGGTKNGTAAGELVIFFNKKISREFDYRVKQAGQLGSKMRFMAASWMGLLMGDVWLRNARNANRAALQLAQNLQRKANIEVVSPVEANAVFARMDDQLARGLQLRGWRFYKFIEPDVYRLMCSWSTTGEEITNLVTDVVAIK
jgi:threonine aldolase